MFAEILYILIAAVIAFFAGQYLEKKKSRHDLVMTRSSDVISQIREVTDNAQSYLTTVINERENISYQVLISTQLKRISTELESLNRIDKKNINYVIPFTNLNNSITKEPFGNNSFTPLMPNDAHIQEIQRNEQDLIAAIRLIEQNN